MKQLLFILIIIFSISLISAPFGLDDPNLPQVTKIPGLSGIDGGISPPEINPSDIDHNDLNNLLWSLAGHTIDIDFDIGGYNLINSNWGYFNDLNTTNINTTKLYVDHIAEKTAGHNVVFDNAIELSINEELKWAGSNSEIIAITTPVELLMIAGDTGVIGINDPSYWATWDASGNWVYRGDLTTPGKGTFGELDVDTLNFNGNVISDSTGTISFSNENLTTTGNITAPVIQNAGATSVLSVQPDATGDEIPFSSYDSGAGVKFFENTDADDENPFVAIYGYAKSIFTPAQKHVAFGIDDYGRLLFGGTFASVTFYSDLGLGTGNKIILGDVTPFLLKSTVGGSSAKNWGVIAAQTQTDHSRYGGAIHICSSDEKAVDWHHNGISNTDDVHLYLHADADSVANKDYLEFYHDAVEGVIISGAGDLILNVTGDNKIIGKNGSGYGEFIGAKFTELSPTIKYDGNLYLNFPTDPNELITAKDKLDIEKLGLSYSKIRVKDECWKEIIGYEWCPKDPMLSADCVEEDPKDDFFEKLPLYKTSCTYKYLNGTTHSEVSVTNTLLISELKAENQMLKEELCIFEKRYSWC